MGITKKITLSYYMTVKNGLPFIKDSINSIKSQVYQNWECVIVDDGSQDGTKDWLKELSSNDSKFKVILTNGIGRGKALNLAVSNTCGEYVTNLDADDYLHPFHAKLMIEFLCSNNLKFACCDSHVVYDTEFPKWVEVPIPFIHSYHSINNELLRRNPICHSGVTMCKESLILQKCYNESRQSQLDYDLWVKFAINSIKMMKMDFPLVAKRIHTKQSFENKKRIRYIYSSFKLQCYAINKLNGGIKSYLYALVRLLYGFLPQKLRVYRK